MKTTLYYRRTNRPHAFPVVRINDVEVTREPHDTGPCDSDWHAVEVDSDYPEAVSVSDGLSEPWLLADAYLIEAALMRYMGLELPRPMSEAFDPWTPESLQDSGVDGCESLCDAVEMLYGYDVANGQRAALASRLSADYLDSHSVEGRKGKVK